MNNASIKVSCRGRPMTIPHFMSGRLRPAGRAPSHGGLFPFFYVIYVTLVPDQHSYGCSCIVVTADKLIMYPLSVPLFTLCSKRHWQSVRATPHPLPSATATAIPSCHRRPCGTVLFQELSYFTQRPVRPVGHGASGRKREGRSRCRPHAVHDETG
jgi:hypothetical protein